MIFPQNDEEMGKLLNKLAADLVKKRKIHKEKYKKFLEYWYTTPRYLEMKAGRLYNRRYWEDENGARWNSWLTWSKAEQLKEDSTPF